MNTQQHKDSHAQRGGAIKDIKRFELMKHQQYNLLSHYQTIRYVLSIALFSLSSFIASLLLWLPYISGKDGSLVKSTLPFLSYISGPEWIFLIGGTIIATTPSRALLRENKDIATIISASILLGQRIIEIIFLPQTCTSANIFYGKRDSCFDLHWETQALLAQLPVIVLAVSMLTLAVWAKTTPWLIRLATPLLLSTVIAVLVATIPITN